MLNIYLPDDDNLTFAKAFDTAVRQGKSPHYLSTDFIAAQQTRDKRRSFSKDSSRRGSRESLESMGDGIGSVNEDVSTFLIKRNFAQPFYRTHQLTFDPRRTYKELYNGSK